MGFLEYRNTNLFSQLLKNKKMAGWISDAFAYEFSFKRRYSYTTTLWKIAKKCGINFQ